MTAGLLTTGAALGRIAFVGAAVFVFDRLTKWWVVEAMDLARVLAIDVWPGFVNFRMAWNRGVNFGLFATDGDAGRWALIALSLAIAAAVTVWALRRRDPLFALGAGLLVGGALGNAWDRFVYGAVADFLNVTCCGVQNPFSFNVADIAIFAGALAVALAPDRRPQAA
ncbi:MAG: signal peptidase II [Rubrimonas sp.]